MDAYRQSLPGKAAKMVATMLVCFVYWHGGSLSICCSWLQQRVSFQSLRMRYVVLRLVASKARNARKPQGKMWHLLAVLCTGGWTLARKTSLALLEDQPA